MVLTAVVDSCQSQSPLVKVLPDEGRTVIGVRTSTVSVRRKPAQRQLCCNVHEHSQQMVANMLTQPRNSRADSADLP